MVKFLKETRLKNIEKIMNKTIFFEKDGIKYKKIISNKDIKCYWICGDKEELFYTINKL